MLDYERVKSLIIPINILLPQRIIQIVKGVSRRRLSNFGQVKMSLSPPATVVLYWVSNNKNMVSYLGL
jgi:hypothetical protein